MLGNEKAIPGFGVYETCQIWLFNLSTLFSTEGISLTVQSQKQTQIYITYKNKVYLEHTVCAPPLSVDSLVIFVRYRVWIEGNSFSQKEHQLFGSSIK